jgi:hypothetical protein
LFDSCEYFLFLIFQSLLTPYFYLFLNLGGIEHVRKLAVGKLFFFLYPLMDSLHLLRGGTWELEQGTK